MLNKNNLHGHKKVRGKSEAALQTGIGAIKDFDIS